nr:periplasmic heavy metal sensor [Maricaulis parjimensis]
MASVLVNGALAGFVIHRTSDGPDWRPPHDREDGRRHGDRDDRRRGGDPSNGFDMRSFLFALPEEARAEARGRLREGLREMRPMMEANRGARERLEALLVADELDQDAIAAELAAMRDVRLAMELHLETVVLDIISDMEPDVRAAAIEAGRGRWSRRDRPGDSRRGDRPPPGGMPPPPPPEGGPDR